MKFYTILLAFCTVFSAQSNTSLRKDPTTFNNMPVDPVFVQVEPICRNGFLSPLPLISTNGITGTWSPALNNQQTTTYTFTPNPGQDASIATMTIIVKQYSDILPNLSCGVWSNNQKTVSWESVTGASSYNLNYQIGNNPIVSITGITALSYTITGVLASDNITAYLFPIGQDLCFNLDVITCQGNCSGAGSDGFISACELSTTLISLSELITGEEPGGSFTRISGTGGVFDAAAGTFIPAAGATNSVFQYTILATELCPSDTSSVNVIIFPTPNAGFDGCLSVADSSTSIVSLATLISGEGVGGSWSRLSGTGGNFNAITGTFTPALGCTTSTFEYKILGQAPCIDDSSIVTIVINGAASQSVDIFCDPTAATTASSVVFDWNSIGQTGFNYSYTINGGPIVRGNTVASNLEVFDLPDGQSTVTLTVQPIGAACFSPTTFSCGRLSVDQLESESVAYYPNPFTDVLNLKLSQPIRSIQILNLLGQQVFASDYNEKNIQINLSYLSNGTYLVKAYAADTIKAFKIVKN